MRLLHGEDTAHRERIHYQGTGASPATSCVIKGQRFHWQRVGIHRKLDSSSALPDGWGSQDPRELSSLNKTSIAQPESAKAGLHTGFTGLLFFGAKQA